VAEDGADLTPGDPIQRYDEATLLGPDTILAHGVHLNPESLKKAADRGCTLVHNPRSNMNNAVGYARGVADYPRVAVGTDGIGSDILTELRTAFLQAREAKLPDAWGLTDRLFRGGFELAQHHLGGERGRLSVGAVGDVILTDYIPPTPLRADNYLGHLLFGFDRSHIRQVWCRGRQVWPTSLDMVEITERSRNAAETLWKHMGDLDG
jgi:cytosine/adenosine deaminase-related metal-dependent hydrolase